MAANPQFEDMPPVEHGTHLADILEFPTRPGRGFLNTEGPLPYDIEVAEWSIPKDRLKRGVGYVQTSVVHLTDESRYVFRKTIPERDAWGSSVDFTLPLATRVTGFNTYLAHKLAQSGMQSRIVGTNQNHGFSLLHDAQAALHILRLDDETAPTRAANESLLTGYSMGTMKALGMLGLAPAFGREIKATIGLDPCLAEKVDYQKQLDELSDLSRYLGREILEVSIILGKSLGHGSPIKSLIRAGHFINTVGWTPEYISNVYDKWKVLASGETGTFPARVPTDAAMVLHFFKECRFNDAGRFRELFAEHPSVKIIEEDGYHLSGASSRVMGRVVSKILRAQHLLSEGVTGKELVAALDTPILG